MELAYIVRDLWRMKLAVAVVAALALFAGLSVGYRIDPSALSIEKRMTQHGAATTEILIDSPVSSLGDLDIEFAPLTSRALAYAQFMTSPPVRAAVAKELELPLSRIVASAPTSASFGTRETRSTTVQGEEEAIARGDVYRLHFTAEPDVPVVAIGAQAKTPEEAARLADGAAHGLIRYLGALQERQEVPAHRRVTVAQLGEAKPGLVVSGAKRIMMVAAAAAVFGFGMLILVLALRISREFRTAREATQLFTAP